MIKGIQDFYYNVRDMERALAFYGALLERAPSYRTSHFSVFEVGGLRLGLHLSEQEIPRVPRDGHGPLAGGTLTFASTDIAGDRARLEGLGAAILAELDETWGHLVVFEDLDGNVVKLMRAKY